MICSSDAARVPPDMRERSQWVLWASVAGKKVPRQARSPKRNASTTNRATWGSFDAATTAAASELGIGFVFTGNDPFVFVDLDWNEQASGLQQRIIQRLDSYTEISPSGAGVHIFVRADKSKIERATKIDALGVEIYLQGRYSTITGHIGTYGQKPIAERTDALIDVVSWLRVPEGKRNSTMMRAAGKLRHSGMNGDEIAVALDRNNIERCTPPLPEDEITGIAYRVGAYDVSGFLAIPRQFLLSAKFAALRPPAKALLIDIAARFTGGNNGQITAPFVAMKERGWRSEGTMYRALKELKAVGLIEVTKQGFSHSCTRYRLPWVCTQNPKGTT